MFDEDLSHLIKYLAFDKFDLLPLLPTSLKFISPHPSPSKMMFFQISTQSPSRDFVDVKILRIQPDDTSDPSLPQVWRDGLFLPQLFFPLQHVCDCCDDHFDPFIAGIISGWL